MRQLLMRFPPAFACCAAATAAFCVAVGGLWSWRVRLLATEAEVDRELRAANAKWTILSGQQEHADAARETFAALKKLEAQFADDRLAPKWASVLKALVTSHGVETELTHIDTQTKADAPEIFELRITGTS